MASMVGLPQTCWGVWHLIYSYPAARQKGDRGEWIGMPRGEKLNCDLGRKWQVLLIQHFTRAKNSSCLWHLTLTGCHGKVLLHKLFLRPAKTSGSSMQYCLPGNSNNIPVCLSRFSLCQLTGADNAWGADYCPASAKEETDSSCFPHPLIPL